MNIDFSGKKALVTGAGRGIGRQIAIHLAQCGAHVYALSRTQSHLDTLQQSNTWAGKIEAVCVDLEDTNATRSAVESLGPIDLLVNNAGVWRSEPFDEIQLEDYERILNVNVKAVINVSQVVVKGMKERGQGGAIVNVSSLAALRGLAFMSAYSSTKAALDKLTQIMAVELGPYQIRVNGVNPQLVDTDMARHIIDKVPDLAKIRAAETPLQRICNVQDVSNVVLFLLSEKAGMVTGTQVPVDGGLLAGKPPQNVA